MTTTTLINYKIIFQRLKNKLIQKLLYVFYKLIRRNISLEYSSQPDAIIFKGNYFQMSWKVKGCYKIVINNEIVLPGNTTSVYLDSRIVSTTINICFYGCTRIIKKRYAVNIIDGDLKQHLYLDNILSRRKIIVHKKALKHMRLPDVSCSVPLPLVPVLVALHIPAVQTTITSTALNLPDPKLIIETYNSPTLTP